MRRHIKFIVVAIIIAGLLGGCTIHPQGEQAQREAALQAGRPFEKPMSQREAPSLPANPTADDLVNYALLMNASLEQHYWEWRSAIEQIPQDGTQPANLAISASTTLNKGHFAADRTMLTAMNDPMADIVWPKKLSVAAQRALENARAAGQRFQKAKFDLRSEVLNAYYDYALNAELIRLEQANAQLLQTTMMVVEARSRSGAAGEADALKAHNELDLSRNDIASLQSRLPALRAKINALLSRDVNAPLPEPAQIPAGHSLAFSDEQLLQRAARNNPELAALASEIKGKSDGIQLARLQYVPDFSISGGADLAGIAQTLMGMVTVPYLRHEAIDAAIAQAQANLKSAQAMRRQSGNDLAARVVMDITTLRDADRQLKLFADSILPRARQAVTLARSSYEAGQSSLLDLIDSQRSLISIERLIARLRYIRLQQYSDLESITATIF